MADKASKKRKKPKRRNSNLPGPPEKKALVHQKKEKGCAKCGETKEYMLDLHHRDPSKKSYTISSGVRSQVTLESFVAELRKCEVLCRNHHAEFHHLNFYKEITLEEYLNDTKRTGTN